MTKIGPVHVSAPTFISELGAVGRSIEMDMGSTRPAIGGRCQFSVLVRLPRLAPFLFELAPVLGEQTVVAMGVHTDEGRPAPLMNKDILRADHAIPKLPHAKRIVVVFEKTDAEAFVQRTKPVQQLS